MIAAGLERLGDGAPQLGDSGVTSLGKNATILPSLPMT
jgi:hypothetical protein